MRTITCFAASLVLMCLASPVFAQLYVLGSFCSNCTTPGNHNRLYDDGLHNDGAAGDGVFGADITIDQPAGAYNWHVSSGDPFGPAYPYCWCLPPYVITAARLWTTGPGDVIHFSHSAGSSHSGWWPLIAVGTDHGTPDGLTMEVGIDAQWDPWFNPPQQTAAATKVGSIWEAVMLVANAGFHTYWFQTPDRSAIFTGSYNGHCGCFLGEQPVAQFTTSAPNTHVRFQFDEARGIMRHELVVATPTARTSWGTLRAMYR